MNVFDALYEGLPPWEIGRPQDAVVRLAEEGLINGDVLDIGCGTGENALFLAELGYDVCGVDVAPRAISKAQAKAVARGVEADFRVDDALDLRRVDRRFDTALDCGLFHTLSNEGRALYRRSLSAVMRPGSSLFVVCFSEDEPGWGGPRRVTKRDLHQAFFGRWAIESISQTRYANLLKPEGSKSWLVRVLYLGVAVSTRN